MKKIVLLFNMLCLGFFFCEAQLINWQTGSGDPCAGTGNGTANSTSDAACITIVDLCRGGGINSASGGDFNSNGFDTSNSDCNDAITDDDCLTWGFDVAAGCSVAAGSVIEFQLDRSNTGPGNYCLDVEIGSGNGFNTISTGTISSSTGCVSDQVNATDINGPITVTFRLCAWGASGGSGTMDIEDGIASCGGAEGGISLTELVPTPVNFTFFTARPMTNKAISLDWSTSSEESNEYFSIEHSINGRDFVEIDQVHGALNSDIERFYSYIHKNAVQGVNYYRLRQVDTDGTYSYSAIEAVTLTGKMEVNIFPTLAESQMTLAVSAELDSDVQIEVYNILGRLVITDILERGATQTILNVANLQKGQYLVRISNGADVHTSRFIKK